MASDVRFEWDPRKSTQNERKHGLSFVDAIQTFFDPLKRVELEGDEHGEVRWRTIGQIGRALYVVSRTPREEGETEIHRIISARRATPRERRVFEKAP
jgi:uncharacterized DUF497 family protein